MLKNIRGELNPNPHSKVNPGLPHIFCHISLSSRRISSLGLSAIIHSLFLYQLYCSDRRSEQLTIFIRVHKPMLGTNTRYTCISDTSNTTSDRRPDPNGSVTEHVRPPH